jgi:hypothetical protein
MSILQELKESVSLWWRMKRVTLHERALEKHATDERGHSSDSAGVVVRRPITEHEIAIIRLTLAMGATEPIAQDVLDRLSDLQAAPGCRCGCESVDFEEFGPERPAQPLAHSIGTTPAGGTVGIIVWGGRNAVTGIEVYDLGAGDGDLKLPLPSSLEPFEVMKGV